MVKTNGELASWEKYGICYGIAIKYNYSVGTKRNGFRKLY